MSDATSTPAGHMTDLKRSRVLVTGATSGLGAAMAAALAEAGARVMVTGRDEARRKRPPRSSIPR
jgi:NAD(P)-dependent dehydrogenase (short-subunit alcohol dehydrogenase family)